MIKKNAFSLIEVLVTVTILTLIGVAISVIVTRSFQGNTKTELIGNVKQNGQGALSIIEKDIRESDTVVCPTSGTGLVLTLLTKTQGQYIRLSMIPQTSTTNGAIYREVYTFQFLPSSSNLLCDLSTYAIGNQSTQTPLIDFSSKSAISLKNISGTGFTVVKSSGFKDTVKVQFDLGPSATASDTVQDSLGGTNNSIQFKTTVQIR